MGLLPQSGSESIRFVRRENKKVFKSTVSVVRPVKYLEQNAIIAVSDINKTGAVVVVKLQP
jgi:hypothetical protein